MRRRPSLASGRKVPISLAEEAPAHLNTRRFGCSCLGSRLWVEKVARKAKGTGISPRAASRPRLAVGRPRARPLRSLQPVPARPEGHAANHAHHTSARQWRGSRAGEQTEMSRNARRSLAASAFAFREASPWRRNTDPRSRPDEVRRPRRTWARLWPWHLRVAPSRSSGVPLIWRCWVSLASTCSSSPT